jgi:uncharacterized protein (TIGR02246 family)
MMVSRPLASALALLLLLTAAGQSHSNPRATTAAASSSDAQIRDLYGRWTRAFEARDVDAIMALYAPGNATVAYDVVAPLQYRGRGAYRKDYQDFLAQYVGRIQVEYRDLRILSSGDLGVLYALERIRGRLKTGENADVWLRATSIARRIGGKWLIVHDHVSVPIDFATGKAILNLKP